MGSGFISGTLWGALVGLLSIALASQLVVRRELSLPEPEAAELEVPAGTEFDQARPETDPVVPSAETRPETETAPAEVTPPGETIVASPLPDTAPAAPPSAAAETAAAPAEPEVPASTDFAVAAGTEASPGSAAPVAPSPAAPPELGPRVPTDAASRLAAPPAAEGAPVTVAGADPAPGRAPAPIAPEAATLPVPGPEAVTTAAAQPALPGPAENPGVSRPAEDPDAGGQIAALLTSPGSDSPPTAGEDTPLAPAAEVAPVNPALPAAPQTEAAALPSGDPPEPGLAGQTPGVSILRLGGDDETVNDEAAEDADADEDGELIGAMDQRAPALTRNAVEFENPESSPLISLILLHDGDALPSTETGLDLPAPVSFAVSGASPMAAQIASAYRAAGREVILIPSLPPGAAATDVEVALQVNFDTVPEAVAVMDAPDTGFQSERTAVSQVVLALVDTGHGLVTYPRGLNTAQQLAARAGVAAGEVFRILDGRGESAGAIGRMLDRAAFRARQEGAVILVGHTRPETVAAVRDWAFANAQNSVALAPISAVLSAD